jgi:hypothetical protein
MGTFLSVLAVVAAFFILMSVRLLFIKGGEFKGTCASQSPFLQKEGGTCGFCGKQVGTCENETGDDQSEVKNVLSKF